MWDKRYSEKTYAYGTEPNEFLAQNYTHLPKGKILSLAEGEGRNAVFLAKNGYAVTAVDSSIVGLNKAQQLAQDNGVTIECIHADVSNFDFGTEKWDGIVSIFFPLPTSLREALYQKVVTGLKKGGVFLLEAYTPEQINYDTGGGKSADSMQTQASLEKYLSALTFTHLQTLERNVIEGRYHTGKGAVVQAIAIKRH